MQAIAASLLPSLTTRTTASNNFGDGPITTRVIKPLFVACTHDSTWLTTFPIQVISHLVPQERHLAVHTEGSVLYGSFAFPAPNVALPSSGFTGSPLCGTLTVLFLLSVNRCQTLVNRGRPVEASNILFLASSQHPITTNLIGSDSDLQVLDTDQNWTHHDGSGTLPPFLTRHTVPSTPARHASSTGSRPQGPCPTPAVGSTARPHAFLTSC
ncbi:hypothetical protein B0T21DRAFT_6589 [Apiosordaria backusii]|uniref:Uncharacterized protein n=1 Tax=Apiosordaria backusii TaxID=314023 RepID=A0AA40K6C7_9PEZI|nr:hypothetical protein B0T21DRAFT_6589 [Apiosordaria backusii]